MRQLRHVFSLLICALLLFTSAHAITYQEGVRAAAKENKPLYLYFYSNG
jgi:hypothetical protein